MSGFDEAKNWAEAHKQYIVMAVVVSIAVLAGVFLLGRESASGQAPTGSLKSDLSQGTLNGQFTGLDGDKVCFLLWNPHTGERKHRESCAPVSELLNFGKAFEEQPAPLPAKDKVTRGQAFSLGNYTVEGGKSGIALGDPIPDTPKGPPVPIATVTKTSTPKGK
ncbi:MAG TPA: hypothetical protein VLE47_00700 [Candidatus Saccharimonadales bacterium]|nr:hypothetical protein [Candidatus Saccharimonadales bacterium]